MKKNLEEIQCTLLCHPLKDVFIDLSPEEIQYNLQQNGLFQAHEEVAVDELEKEHVWEIAQKEFERLKKAMEWPRCPYLYFPDNSGTITDKKKMVLLILMPCFYL